MVRLPPAVRVLTFRVVRSRVKFPAVALGDNPAIKLPGAGVQEGVNGNAPFWLDVVTVRAAEAELTKTSKARHARLTAIFHFELWSLFITIFGVGSLLLGELRFGETRLERKLDTTIGFAGVEEQFCRQFAQVRVFHVLVKTLL